MGGVYVGWSDFAQGRAGILATRLNADGTRAAGWAEYGTPVSVGPQSSGYSRQCTDGAGGLLMAWGDSRGGGSVYAQRLLPDGTIAPGWQENGNPILVGWPAGLVRGMVPDGSGGAYVCCDPGTDFTHDVYLTRFTGAGTVAPGWPAQGVEVCGSPPSQQWVSMAPDDSGGVLISWSDGRVFALHILPDGTRAPGWQYCGNRVSTEGGTQFESFILPTGSGGSYVAFQTSPPRGFIQKLTPQGERSPDWIPSALFVDLPASNQQDIAMVTDGRGGAITAWLDQRNGINSQIYAQRYGGNGPTPALVSLVRASAEPGRVTLTWHTPDRGVVATVYRRSGSTSWIELSREAFDGTGTLRYEDMTVARSTRYAYRLGILESGAETFTDATWVEIPAGYALAVEGIRPNPVQRELRVAFALPEAAPATLELLDIAGRQVLSRTVGELGVGRHLVLLGDVCHLTPGVYWVRITQRDRSHTLRAIVMR